MDIGLSLNGTTTASQLRGGGTGGGTGGGAGGTGGTGGGTGGGGGGTGGTGLQPITGILDAANVVILGASIFEGAFESADTVLPALTDFAAKAGFTGTLRSYARSGDTLTSTLLRHGDARTDLAATEGNNLYVVHSGGNNVSFSRPYPGNATSFETDYTALMQAITATDRVVPLPLTKRLYGRADPNYPNNPLDVAQGDAASEANGSKPYNDAIILPAIATHAPDWLSASGAAHVDPYAFIDSHPETLSPDGVHGPNLSLARYVLAKLAGRAMGRALTDSRAGKSYLFDLRSGNPVDARIGAANLIQGYPDGVTAQPLFYGASAMDNSFDPHLVASTGTFRNGTTGMDATCYPRLADSRFHDLALVGAGVYVQDAIAYTVRFAGLAPGDMVTVSCCGVRGAAGTNRSGTVTLTGGQSLTLNAASDAASNQVVFAPVPVPADGVLEVTLTVAPGSTYGYLHGILLDFAQ